jgi:hypothetical protein
MRGCQPCQGFLSSLEETVRGCRETPEITPSPRKTAEVRNVLLSKLQKAVAGNA